MKSTLLLPAIFLSLFALLSACQNEKKESQSSAVEDQQTTMDQLEKNKEMVVTFYQELFGNKNLEAIDQYIGDVYIQHNPMAPDGKEALKAFLKPWFENVPKDTVDIQFAGAYDDRVFLHIRTHMGGKEYAVVDMFRIENGKIVEHWDVIQEVPENAVSEHPMF
jgi:predicted SnoaL-like aldol condensation-catalyzing enzyme